MIVRTWESVLAGAGVVESVTVTVKVELPAAVGVPEMIPAEESAKPVGNALPDERIQVKGPVLPKAVRAAL